MSKKEFINEIDPRLVGLTSYNQFCYHVASSRSVMSSTHLSQHLVLNEPDEPMMVSGIEKELAKYNFTIKMPEDGVIKAVIERYPKGVGKDVLGYNPETLVIYEKESTKQLDCFTIKDHLCNDQYFGFKYKAKDGMGRLTPGASIAKDTVFADTPAATANGGYAYGLNLNTALMSVPGVAEDGFVVSKSAAKRFNYTIYDTRIVEFGSKEFPLNIHGSVDNYKIFPDIGESLTGDGLLMALRKYDSKLSPSMMSIYDTMEVDHIFDNSVYLRGPNGRVVDIKVIGSNASRTNLPCGMTEQLVKYQKAFLNYNKKILEVESRLRYERKRMYGEESLNLSPKLHHTIVEALVYTNEKHPYYKNQLNLLYKKIPLDTYMVEIVVEYHMNPGLHEGAKMANKQGTKGVVCQIREDEDMPVDEAGNRADVIMDPTSIVSRINIGVLYEHYINGASRDVAIKIRNLVNLKKGEANLELLSYSDKWRDAYSLLLKYFKIINSTQYKFYVALGDEQKLTTLVTVINEMIYSYIPVNNDKMTKCIVKELEAEFKPTFGKVTYVDDDGNKVTTVKNVRIAPIYHMLLDKIADDWAACDSGKLHHFGIITPLTKHEKFRLPYKNQSPRTCGESESRIIASYAHPRLAAEIMDRSNNPQTTRNMFFNILRSDNPTSIDNLVDRDTIPFGNTKPMALVRHIMSCAGFIPKYEPEDK